MRKILQKFEFEAASFLLPKIPNSEYVECSFGATAFITAQFIVEASINRFGLDAFEVANVQFYLKIFNQKRKLDKNISYTLRCFDLLNIHRP